MMDFGYRILAWIFGIIALALGWFFIFLFTELKVLIFDKTLTVDEKNEIFKEIKWLYSIPFIIFISYFLLPLQRFIFVPCFFVLVALFAFFLSKGRKDRKDTKPSLDKKIEGAADFLSDAKELGDDFHNNTF